MKVHIDAVVTPDELIDDTEHGQVCMNLGCLSFRSAVEIEKRVK